MLNIICSSVITLSVISVFVAIAIDFLLYNERSATKCKKKSIVATGSMVGFYLVYYLVIRFHIGTIHHKSVFLVILGTTMIAIGAVINLLGRLHLGSNWANHIKIYEEHVLITSGAYSIVRHPLYSSIMLMLLGGSLAYRNYLSLLLTALVFIPFMYYRAKQEETLLSQEFENYQEFKSKTGMFFPRIWR